MERKSIRPMDLSSSTAHSIATNFASPKIVDWMRLHTQPLR